MKLCEIQKELIVLLIPIIVSLIAFASGFLDLSYTIFVSLVVDLPILFFSFLRREHRKKQERRRKKLNDHHQDLKEKVLTRWLNLSINTVNYIKDFPRAMNSFYLATWSSIKGRDRWHKWAIQHVYDEEGYPKLKSLFEKLETHEKNHNNFVFSLLKTISTEIKEVLKTLPTLKEHGKWTDNNFYHMKNVLFSLHNYKVSLMLYPEELIDEDGRVIARAKGDSETLRKLEGEIKRIRTAHKQDFEKVENSVEEDKKLLNNINKHVNNIIYDLSLEKPLKGKCDYEPSLDSLN